MTRQHLKLSHANSMHSKLDLKYNPIFSVEYENLDLGKNTDGLLYRKSQFCPIL
jgi:hypothetical protein